ncbi:hypothetical protein RclHR1_01600014 [Rhizophagus clarus]|nr:hypothetical protein RclHR1_01600014 [Rhizophagus clarus]
MRYNYNFLIFLGLIIIASYVTNAQVTNKNGLPELDDTGDNGIGNGSKLPLPGIQLPDGMLNNRFPQMEPNINVPQVANSSYNNGTDLGNGGTLGNNSTDGMVLGTKQPQTGAVNTNNVSLATPSYTTKSAEPSNFNDTIYNDNYSSASCCSLGISVVILCAIINLKSRVM